MTTPKVQHYVPQFLLRNFCEKANGQLWAYDKLTGRSFPSHPKNVASESRFYDFEFQGDPLSIEPWLSELEGEMRLIVKSILERDSLAELRDDDRHVVASFLAVQLTRTKAFRENWASFPRMLRDFFARSGDVPVEGSQSEELTRDLSANDLKEQTSKRVFEAPDNYAHLFLEKDWILVATAPEHPFYVSDNPLARHNMFRRAHRSTTGLASRGIEIYFPLSSVRALALFCPSLTENFRDASANAPKNVAHDMEKWLIAVRTGNPLFYASDGLKHFNSLQVGWSERFLFSSANDFQIASWMVANNPELKKGPRYSVT